MDINLERLQEKLTLQQEKKQTLSSLKERIQASINESSFISELSKKDTKYNNITSFIELTQSISELANTLYEDYIQTKNSEIEKLDKDILDLDKINSLYEKIINEKLNVSITSLDSFYSSWEQDVVDLKDTLIIDYNNLKALINEVIDESEIEILKKEIKYLENINWIKFLLQDPENYTNFLKGYFRAHKQLTLKGISRRAGSNLNFDNLIINDKGLLEGYVQGDKAKCRVWMDDDIYKNYKIKLKSFN